MEILHFLKWLTGIYYFINKLRTVESYFYLAPEVINKKTINEKVYVWSLGIIFDEIINSSVFFNGESDIETILNIKI